MAEPEEKVAPEDIAFVLPAMEWVPIMPESKDPTDRMLADVLHVFSREMDTMYLAFRPRREGEEYVDRPATPERTEIDTGEVGGS